MLQIISRLFCKFMQVEDLPLVGFNNPFLSAGLFLFVDCNREMRTCNDDLSVESLLNSCSCQCGWLVTIEHLFLTHGRHFNSPVAVFK